MSKILLQCNDVNLLNLLKNSSILDKISHLIYNSPNELFDLNHIKELFKVKLQNRYLKTLLQVHINEELNISKFIKNLCNYGFDGFVFTIDNMNMLYKLYQIIEILNLLPEPYNFSWEIYYLNLNNNKNLDIKFINKLSGIISSNKKDNSIKIYNTKSNYNLDNVFIFDINMNIIDLLKNTDILINKIYNHINYPTSKFLKQIFSEKNTIFNMNKRHAIYTKNFNLGFFK
jgi:hypothetical protein